MKKETHDVYLDVCALCRPFDNQDFIRIRLEAAAVELITENIKQGNYKLYYSKAHLLEINKINDSYERNEVKDLLLNFGENPWKNKSLQKIRKRAEELVSTGFGIADAAHVAYSESFNIYFITCDDKLLKKCIRYNINTWCSNPVEFCEKEKIK